MGLQPATAQPNMPNTDHASSTSSSPPLPQLRVSGADLVDPEGEAVLLRGTNIGNWLLIEPWMFGIFNDNIRDQHTFLSILVSRFGAERTDALMEGHRTCWFTERDANHIASFCVNVVRLPIHYSHMLTDDGELRDDAFRWIDLGIDYAERAGLYTILDLHGAPGGQSVDAPTGRLGQNRLWSDPEMQRRTIQIWSALAERYADRASVAAYDLLNEPYGDFGTDIRPALIDLLGRLHDAVREHDPHTLVLAPGTIRGVSFYCDLAERGWTNAGYTEHFYPTIFGDASPSIGAHQRFVDNAVQARSEFLARNPAPYLVGEMNPVFERVGGPAMKRAYFDLYDTLGWSTTMWSYKLYTPAGGINNDNWWMVANKDPLQFDIERDSYEELLGAVNGFATEELVVDDDLRRAMTSPTATKLLAMPAQTDASLNTTAQDDWTTTTIGEGPAASSQLDGTRFEVRAGGRDVFGTADSLGFMSRTLGSSTSLFTTIDEFDAQDRFAKAGVMLRASNEADAAHALIHVFRDGRIILAWRAETGGATQERTLATTGFPARLGLTVASDGVTAVFADATGERRTTAVPIDTSNTSLLGIAVCAHEPEVTATASGSLGAKWTSATTTSSPTQRNAVSREWSSWGDGWQFGDATRRVPVAQRDPSATGEAGVWQDIELRAAMEPGISRRVRIEVTLGSRTGAGTLELRAEVPVRLLGDQRWLTLESQPYDLGNMGMPGPARMTLAVDVPAHFDSQALRVLVVHTPGENATDTPLSITGVAIHQDVRD